MWTTVLICTILIVVVLYLLWLFRKIEFDRNQDRELYNFSADIHFNPFPTEINVSNPYVCTGENLKPCKLDDQTSCIGCQSMIARCVNFPNDTLYFDSDGNEYTIPKNEDPNDGYCLTLTNDININCNVFHGDLAIVKLDPDDQTSMFFCNCKNPGLIGNTSLLGACDIPFICNGEIDEINQPIEDIKCKCPLGQISTQNNENIPICVDMTIAQANNAGILNDVLQSVDIDTTPIENYNPQLQNRLTSVKELIHPCKLCPLTQKRIPNGIYGTMQNEKFCSIHMGNVSYRNSYLGIPYRRSPHERLLVGDIGGPDAVLGAYWHELVIYEDFEFRHQTTLYKIEYQLNEDIYKALNLNPLEFYWIKSDTLMVGLHIATPPVNFDKIPGSSCWEQWPNYDCTFSVDMMDGTNLRNVPFNNNVLEYIAPNSNILRTPQVVRPSGPFLFRDAWDGMQDLNQSVDGWVKEINGELYPYFTINGFTSSSVRQSIFAENAQMISWGFRRRDVNASYGWEYTMYSNHNADDWNTIQNRLIPRL